MGGGIRPTHLEYSTVAGYFLQDEEDTNPGGFDYTEHDFGLIFRPYPTDLNFDPEGRKTQWERFFFHLQQMNENSPEEVNFKLLFMGRHGQGNHNVAEAHYGREAWDCYWAAQDGDGILTWSDAHLTENGKEEAQVAHDYWEEQIMLNHIHTPQSYYVSPLYRTCDTAKITFGDLPLSKERPFRPMIKELLREAMGVHTCDRRSAKSYIHEHFPDFEFEEGFTEEDKLWRANERETNLALDQRMKMLLDDIFLNDKNSFISFTAHSAAITSILRVVNHRDFPLRTGAIIPVLVKITTVDGIAPPATSIRWDPASTCAIIPSGTNSI